MNLFDLLPALEIHDATHRRRGGATRHRTFRLTPGGRRRAGPGLLWRLGAFITRRLGGAPACPVCRRRLDHPTDWLCAHCGTPVYPGNAPGRRSQWAPRVCPDCGFTGLPDDAFCPRCAVRLRVSRAAVRGERQVRAAKRAALGGTGHFLQHPVTSGEPGGVLLLQNSVKAKGKARRARPVQVDAHERDGVPVESYTRAKPGEGGQA